jgi:hypothetical protein
MTTPEGGQPQGAPAPPPQAAPGVIPGAGAPAPAPGWAGPSQAEWEAQQASSARMAELLGQLVPGTTGKPSTSAAGDDEEDDDEEDDDTAPPSRQAAQDRTKPPSWDELDKITAAMRKAARGERRMRQRVAEWRDQDAARQAQLTQAQQIAEASERARKEAEARFLPATIRAATIPALLKADARADRVDALYSMIDQSRVGVEGDSVSGLDEQVTALKERFPEWFTTAPQQQGQPQQQQNTGGQVQGPPPGYRPPAPRVTTGDRPPVEERAVTSAEKIAQMVRGAIQ